MSMTPRRRRFLRYWSLNMLTVRSWGWAWTPGFSYTPAEWLRFEALAGRISSLATSIWLTATSVIFIILAAIAVGGLMIPLASALWPDPAKTSALAFVSLLALTSFLTIGFGLPISIVWGGRIADWFEAGPRPDDEPEDAALAGKITGQFWRLIAIMCILFIPGTMILIIFNIDAGPLLTVLRAATVICFGVGLVSARFRKASAQPR